MARRNPADGAALDPALTQKKRARRRLVGAVTLGIIAALVLPLVLDSEPRQTISDVEIEIPPREAALPEVDLPKPEDAAIASPGVEEIVVPPSPSEPVAQPTSDPKAVARVDPESPAPAEAPAATAESAARPQSASKVPAPSQSKAPASAKNDAPSAAPKTAPAAASKTAPAAAAKPAPAAAPRPARAEAPKVATAQPRAETATASGTRYALQVGAFANAGSARAQLDKARRTGLRAYTETVKTAQGERTRVRVGPFPSREEAEKARATLKLAGIESAVVDAGAVQGTR